MTQRHDLDLLRWHWGTFYSITFDDPCWRAERRDDGFVLTADTSARLRLLLREDYAARPVSRQGGARRPARP